MLKNKNFVTSGSKLLVINEPELASDNLEDLVANLGTNNKFVKISDFKELLDAFRPDVVLTNISVNGDSFLDIYRFMKNSTQYSDIPVVAVIDINESDRIDTVLKAGADDFIYSPVNPLELRSRLANQFYIVKYRNEWHSELIHMEALNKEKNEILAIAAHDLKNPIFSIQLLGKTIRDDTTLTKDELNEFSNDIVASCDRIIDIIKQLLDLNSIESGKINIDIKPQYVIESVMHFIELYKHKAGNKNININFDYTSDGMASTDLVSFNNIFDNFISNAVKYSPFNKSIFVKMCDINDRLVVSVSDQGPGIPQSEQDKLFKKFAKISNKPTGGENSTGLGLSIVKKFSELINAEIKFENNTNSEGATFSVILPKY